MVDVNTEIKGSIAEFAAWTYFAGTKTGRNYLFESGKIAKSYAAKQLRLTARTFVVEPSKRALKSGAKKAIQGSIVRVAPPLAILVVGGMAFNAVGNTAAVQKTGHIGNPGVLGMGGTL